MGSCLPGVNTPENVLKGNKTGVVFLPKKKSMCRAKIIVETPGNLLTNDSSETSDKETQSYSNSFTMYRVFSFSDPLNKKIEKERFFEECFEMSHSTNVPHQISTTKLKTARPEQTSLKLQPSVSLSTRFLPEHSSSELHLTNIISSWADYYEEFDSNNSSNLTGLQTDDTILSENDVILLQDIITSTSTTVFTDTRGISVEPGKVLAMCLTKDGHRFKQLNIDMTLDDVVASFLSTDNITKLPLSITESKKSRPRIMGRNQMVLTIGENLGPRFDVKTQGLIFATGIVNSRLCHKVCIGDLHHMQKIFSHEAKRQKPDE